MHIHTYMFNTVTQALGFMVEVEDDEEWLVNETTDDIGITRYVARLRGRGGNHVINSSGAGALNMQQSHSCVLS